MTSSPYVLYKNILLDDTYGAARRLQDFVIYQYQSGRYPFDIDEHRGGLDSRHLQIFTDLKNWMWDNGPDLFFNEIAETIISKRRAAAQANFNELTELRAVKPEDYVVEPGTDAVRSHKTALDNCEMHHKRYAEMGFEIEELA